MKAVDATQIQQSAGDVKRQIEEIKKNVAIGINNIKDGPDLPPGTSVVLILGNSGAGKTTLINYLAGNKLKVIKAGYPPKLALSVENEIAGLKIGHTTTSETTHPNKYYHESEKILFWDCPGFGDNRGPVQDISNAYYIKMLFDKYPQIKILSVIPEDSFGGRVDNFIKLMNAFTTLFMDDSYMQGLDFVITKATTFDPDGLSQHVSTIRLEEACDSLKTFLLNKITSNSVGVCYSPTQSDTQGEIVIECGQSCKVMDLLKNNMYAHNPQVGYPISAETKVVIHEMQIDLEGSIKRNVLEVNDLLKNYIRTIKAEKSIDNSAKSISALRRLKEKLKSISSNDKDANANILSAINDMLKMASDDQEKNDAIIEQITCDTQSASFFADLQSKSDANIKNHCFILLNEIDNALDEIHDQQVVLYSDRIKTLEDSLTHANLADKKSMQKDIVKITPEKGISDACQKLISFDDKDEESYLFAIDTMKSLSKSQELKNFYDQLIAQYPNKPEHYHKAAKDLSGLYSGIERIKEVKHFYDKLTTHFYNEEAQHRECAVLLSELAKKEGSGLFSKDSVKNAAIDLIKEYYNKFTDQQPQNQGAYEFVIDCVDKLNNCSEYKRIEVMKHFYDKLTSHVPLVGNYKSAIAMMEKYTAVYNVKHFYDKLTTQYPNDEQHYKEAAKNMQKHGCVSDIKSFYDKLIAKFPNKIAYYSEAVDIFAGLRMKEYTKDYNAKLLERLEKHAAQVELEQNKKASDYYTKAVKNMEALEMWDEVKVFGDQALKRSELSEAEISYYKDRVEYSQKSSCVIYSVEKIVYNNPFLNLSKEQVAKLIHETGLSFSELLTVTDDLVQNGMRDALSEALNNNFAALLGGAHESH